MALWYREKGEQLLFKVRVQPRSAKNKITGLYGDAVKICLTSPPVDGAANKMCREFLAKTLGLPKHRVMLIAGFKSRLKTWAVEGVPLEELRRKLGT